MEKKIIPITTTRKKTPTKRKASTSEIVKTKANTVDTEKLESVVLDGNLEVATGKTKLALVKQEQKATKAQEPKAKKEPKPPVKPSSQASTVQEFIELKNRDFAKVTKINMDTSRGVEHWKREAWSLMPETLNDSMVHCVERLRLETSGVIAYRFGYYIISKNGTWVRPMNTPMYEGNDFNLLYEKAKAEGTIL